MAMSGGGRWWWHLVASERGGRERAGAGREGNDDQGGAHGVDGRVGTDASANAHACKGMSGGEWAKLACLRQLFRRCARAGKKNRNRPMPLTN